MVEHCKSVESSDSVGYVQPTSNQPMKSSDGQFGQEIFCKLYRFSDEDVAQFHLKSCTTNSKITLTCEYRLPQGPLPPSLKSETTFVHSGGWEWFVLRNFQQQKIF